MADNRELVSIVVPAYNAEKYIRECADSLLGQTYQNVEFIFVDDGSTDKTKAILTEYAKKDSRVKILEQENKFAGVARNNGLAAAQGKYIMFLDADDYFASTMIENLYKKSEESDSDVTIAGYYKYDNETQNISEPKLGYEEEFVTNPKLLGKKLFQICNPAPWFLFIKREMITKNHLLFQDTRNSNDLLFTRLVLAKAEKILCLNERFVYYRVNNAMSLRGGITEACFIEALLKLKDELDKFDSMTEDMWDSFFIFADKTIAYNFNLLINVDIAKLEDIYSKIIGEVIPHIFSDKYIISYSEDIVSSRCLSEYFRKRCDRIEAECSKKVLDIKNSKSYKLGDAILHPFKK